MKSSFAFSLKGKDWWGPFLGYWILFLAIYIPNLLLSKLVPVSEKAGLYFLFVILFMFLMVVIQSIFTILILRILIPKVSIDGKSFAFRGSIGEYLGINMLGMLLSVVTLTVYIPWYTRRIIAYLASETTFDGANPAFLGKGGRLFKYFVLALWVPVIVVSVLAGVLIAVGARGGDTGSTSATQLMTMLITFLVIFIVFVPFMFLMMKWYINVAFKDLSIVLKAPFWPSCGFIFGQLLLTVITLGIYGPAALLRGYRYFAPDVVLSRGDQEAGRLSFEGALGKGFGLIWGQSLLCVITLGVYIPWAYARIGSWMASSTFLERNA
jgi:uncharacterized membrane protein YjgN (DUF898 family)